MNALWAGILGLVQGLTEFLPVSSSGHLVLLQSIIPGFEQTGVTFDVLLHLATVFAVLVYFRKDLLFILKNNFLFLLSGTVPAAVIGILLSDFLEGLFANTFLVGFALIITGILNYLTTKSKETKTSLTVAGAFLIGIAQALAITPGISRSGSTIFAGTKFGISRKKAAEFSFILSIPAILGATILQFVKYGFTNSMPAYIYLIGFLTAFISGYLAIWVVFKLLAQKRYNYFAYYAIIVGILVIALK